MGSHLLPLLLAEYEQVAAVTRRPLGVSAPNLREVAFGGDFESVGPVDAAFCCLGTTIRKAGSQEAFRKVDFDAVADFARAARKSGARHLALVSSVDASTKSPNFYLRVKGEAEQTVSGLGFKGVYLLRPSFLVGERAESRPGEKIGIAVARTLGFLMIGPLARYRAIDAAIVARAMLAAVRQGHPGSHVIEYAGLTSLCKS